MSLQLRTYINGALYSILARRKIRQRARQLGLSSLLVSLRPNVEVRVQQQFDYILRLLSAHETADTATDVNHQAEVEVEPGSDDDGEDIDPDESKDRIEEEEEAEGED